MTIVQEFFFCEQGRIWPMREWAAIDPKERSWEIQRFMLSQFKFTAKSYASPYYLLSRTIGGQNLRRMYHVAVT
jgi:hypothetical protein